MSKYEALFEDEDDIFGGTPQSKYWDIFKQLNHEIAEDQLDKIIEKMAVMERMLMEHHDEEELNGKIKQYYFENITIIDDHKKCLYMEFGGDLIFTLSD